MVDTSVISAASCLRVLEIRFRFTEHRQVAVFLLTRHDFWLEKSAKL